MLFISIETFPMGIRHLYPYIDDYNKTNTDRPYTKVNNNIYTPKTLYIDLTSKIISFSMQYLKKNEQFVKNNTIEAVIENIIPSLTEYIAGMLAKQSKYNQHIHIFTDIVPVAEDQQFQYDLFSDFVSQKRLNTEERLRSIVLIKREHVNKIMEYNNVLVKLICLHTDANGTVHDYSTDLQKAEQEIFGQSLQEFIAVMIRETKYMHVFMSVASLFDTTDDVRDYVSLHYILEQYTRERGDNDNENIDYTLISNTVRDEINCDCIPDPTTGGSSTNPVSTDPIYSTPIYPYINEDYRFIPLHYSSTLHSSIYSLLQFIEDTILRRYLIYISAKFSEKQRRKQHKQTQHMPCIPTLLFLLPTIVKHILSTRKFSAEIQIFGCEMEADFAIIKHISTYNRRSFPIIDSPDTDMLCNLCDTPCLIHMKRTYPFRGDTKSPVKTKEYYINPVNFWKHVFGCRLSTRIIKILCVLLGTDYNPYDKQSPIHMKSFDEILDRLHISSYSEIDEDALLFHIYNIMVEHPTDKYVIATAIALNLYLSESIESKLHNLLNEIRTVNIDIAHPLQKQKVNESIHINHHTTTHLSGHPTDFNMEDTLTENISDTILRKHSRCGSDILFYGIDSRSPILQFDDCVRGMSQWN